jgi:hypothetical protein
VSPVTVVALLKLSLNYLLCNVSLMHAVVRRPDLKCCETMSLAKGVSQTGQETGEKETGEKETEEKAGVALWTFEWR